MICESVTSTDNGAYISAPTIIDTLATATIQNGMIESCRYVYTHAEAKAITVIIVTMMQYVLYFTGCFMLVDIIYRKCSENIARTKKRLSLSIGRIAVIYSFAFGGITIFFARQRIALLYPRTYMACRGCRCGRRQNLCHKAVPYRKAVR